MGDAAQKEKINGFDLMDWFVFGSEEVKSHKKHLNEINVFPVADGDTGTNLSSTLRAMTELPRKREAFHEIMKEGVWQEDSADYLKKRLKVWGDSIIVMNRSRRLKVHLHTDVPHLVTEELLNWGHIINQKLDDMGLETRVLSRGKGGLGILTDSIGDLPEEYKTEHLIHTIPIGIQMDMDTQKQDLCLLGDHRVRGQRGKSQQHSGSHRNEAGTSAHHESG